MIIRWLIIENLEELKIRLQSKDWNEMYNENDITLNKISLSTP